MENKTGKYFKYAIGEITLVMIGILLALQVNNWNEQRKLFIQEKGLLEELNKNLQSNIDILNNYIVDQEEKQKELHIITAHFDEKKSYTDTLGMYLRNVRKGEYLSLVTSAFESLKSIGFNIIRDDELRMAIINLFNYTYEQNIKSIHSITEMQYESTHNVFVKYLSFKNDNGEERLVANNYDSLLVNNELYNLITYRNSGKVGVINMATRILNETKVLKQQVMTSLNVENHD